MIHGAHVIIYSKDSEADRAFLRDVLNYKAVDAGHGWLIFALPPAEVTGRLLRAVNAFETVQHDDVALVALRVTPERRRVPR